MVLDPAIKPDAFEILRDDHRHPVVDRPDEFVRVRRDDCAGLDFRLVRGGPAFVQAGETERPSGLQVEIGRGLLPAFRLPLVESIGHDQASPFLEGAPEAWLGSNGFRPGIDHLAADRWVFRLTRDEPPPEGGQLVPAIATYDSGDRLGRGDVPARLMLAGNRLDVEFILDDG